MMTSFPAVIRRRSAAARCHATARFSGTFAPERFNFFDHSSTPGGGALYPGGIKVKFAWSSGDLHAVCASEKLLQQRFGDTAAAVKFLLTVLAHADSLGELRPLRSLQLLPTPPTQKHRGRLLIRHKEIDMTTELLSNDDTVVYDEAAASSSWINPIRRLRIVSISSNA